MTGLGVAALLLTAVVVCTARSSLVCPDVRGLIGACVIDCTEGSCADGQLCCSNGCGRTCMDGVPRPVNCSDPEQDGVQFNPTPCEICSCDEGRRICAIVDCALPDCGEGLQPYTPEGECCSRCPQPACPDVRGLIGTCDERCSEDRSCEDGQLCCSNGCGHACMVPSVNCSGLPDGYSHQRTPCETCSCNGGQLSCDRIVCDWPQCPGGVTPVTAPGECCPGCPTSCTDGGNTYDNGASWTCSDGCNTCSCSNGLIISTLIACAPCTEGGNTYVSGASWNCSDGCNTCNCRNGVVISTRRACAPTCTDDTGVVYQAGQSWRCRGGCPTCTCRHGRITVNATGCPSNCTHDGYTIPEGQSYKPDPCTTCHCTNGEKRCAIIACAPPYCGQGVEPITVEGKCCPECPPSSRPPHIICPDLSDLVTTCDVGCASDDACNGNQICCRGGCSSLCVDPVHLACPDTSGLIGTCVESCRNSSQCESGRLCCSNGCGHACLTADVLNCSSVECPALACDYGVPFTPEGACCPRCPEDCRQVFCAYPDCSDGEEHVTPVGQCCPICQCNPNRCPVINCLWGTPYVPDGGCCPQCPSTPRNCTEGGNTYASGTSWNCSDGCNTCRCFDGNVASTEIFCPASCTDATGVHPSGGPSWTCPDGCNTCTCYNGAIASTRILCAPCTDDTGVVYQAGQSWRCRGGCPTCTCRHGRITVNATGCPSNCTHDGYTIPEGQSYKPDPCTTCHCTNGEKRCAVIACAPPNCGQGVEPITVEGKCCPECPPSSRPPHIICPDLSDLVTTCDVGCASDDACNGNQICCRGGCSSLCVDPVRLACPDTSGLIGICVESCRNSSQCESGRLCCSNGCGHACLTADVLNCSSVECPALACDYGVPFTPEGACCPRCPEDCRVVLCANPNCEAYEDEVIPVGQCCATCRCNRMLCPVFRCASGAPITPEGDCCPRCPRSCTEGGNTYNSGASWTCSDGCNTCRCFDGNVASTEQACAPCTDATGVHPSGGPSWTCPDGCNTCTCRSGLIASTRRACAPCTEGGNTYASGTSWTCSDGCNTCSCSNGLIISTLIACAPCTEGGNTYNSGTSWNCSDGCNTCFCRAGIVASTKIACPPSCENVRCASVLCEPGYVAVVQEGDCCPSCQDCSSVSCNTRECGENERRIYPDNQCCFDCQDCGLVRCAAVDCEYGMAFTPDGECCQQCPPAERLCEEYRSVFDVSDMDPCIRCECNADFVYECTRVTTGAGCSPLSCELEDKSYPSGTFFTEGCSRCECRNGVAQCSETSCSANDRSSVKFDMGFAGDYDDYKDITTREELIKVLKRRLVSKFKHLNLMDSQVKDVQVYKGSVYITFTVVAMEGGADPSTVAKTLETEHRSGALLLVSGNQTLVPLTSTFSVEYGAAGGSVQDGSYVAAIAVPVVVGVVAIVAIVAAVIVIMYVIKTKHNQQPRGKAIFSEGVCSIENVYIAPEEDEKMKWDSSSIGSDKPVKV